MVKMILFRGVVVFFFIVREKAGSWREDFVGLSGVFRDGGRKVFV